MINKKITRNVYNPVQNPLWNRYDLSEWYLLTYESVLMSVIDIDNYYEHWHDIIYLSIDWLLIKKELGLYYRTAQWEVILNNNYY